MSDQAVNYVVFVLGAGLGMAAAAALLAAWIPARWLPGWLAVLGRP